MFKRLILISLIALSYGETSYSLSFPLQKFEEQFNILDPEFWKKVIGSAITDIPKGNSSALIELKNGQITFSGILAPGDGLPAYASYRLQRLDSGVWNLSMIEGLTLRFIGDGRTYRFIVKDLAAVQATSDYSFQYEFQTQNGVEQSIRVTFKDLKPFLRNIQMPDDISLDLTQVVQVGLQIIDRTPGPFHLTISNVSH